MWPRRLESPAGLAVQVNANGSIRRIEHRDVVLNLLYAQDVALAPYGAIRMNEYYVSQYLDHTPLRHPRPGRRDPVRIPLRGYSQS